MNKNKLTIVFFSLCVFSVSIIMVCLGLNQHVKAPSSLGSVRLNVETYLAGMNQPTHPSVYRFDEPWNGYQYWMAYSPYPEANGEEENPCIAVSNDLLYWETPDMLSNPIADNEETGCNELKDPHLVYREDEDRLEVWYLGRLSQKLGGDGSSLLLMRKYSTDGVSWSDYEIMSDTQYLSPSIIWNGNEYQMWSIGYDLYDTTGTICYQVSKDGHNWSDPKLCSVGMKNTDIDIWHGSVTFYNDVYYLSYIDNTDKQEVYCCTSLNGSEFCQAKLLFRIMDIGVIYIVLIYGSTVTVILVCMEL